MVQSIQISKRPSKATKVNNPAISFTEEDARRLHHPHDDALVISLSIANFNIWQVLVDNGSSANILYYPAFQQMRVDKERFLPSDTPLVGFGGTKVFHIGTITLPVTIGTYPQQLTKEVNFLVIDFSSTYNAIIGWPTLNAWREVTSTYHLLVKFPTKYKISKVQGDQMVACECYIAMLEMDDHLQALNIEERRIAVKPTENLEEISLDDNIPGWVTRISTQANPLVRKELALFLKNNRDVFAWSHEDILGIGMNTMVHKLTIYPSFPLVWQKKRVFA